MTDKKYRLVTRNDLDGLICAVLLKEIDLIDDVLFVHPNDMNNDLIQINYNDITSNLPYQEHVHLAFNYINTVHDFASAETNIIDVNAHSSAHVVYNYFGGVERFNATWEEIVNEVDNHKSDLLSKENLLNTKDNQALSVLFNPKTGLNSFKEFSVSNFLLMANLFDLCKTYHLNDALDADCHSEMAQANSPIRPLNILGLGLGAKATRIKVS